MLEYRVVYCRLWTIFTAHRCRQINKGKDLGRNPKGKSPSKFNPYEMPKTDPDAHIFPYNFNQFKYLDGWILVLN